MLVELPPFRYAVALTRESLNTQDTEDIASWLGANLSGGIWIMNLNTRAKITFGLPGVAEPVEGACDAIFMFEQYNDALHFQMRFIG